MVLAELLVRAVVLVLLRPDAGAAELVLGAALMLLVVAAAAVLAAPPASAPASFGGTGFHRVRVLLRMSDPAAAGHRMARAPGATS